LAELEAGVAAPDVLLLAEPLPEGAIVEAASAWRQRRGTPAVCCVDQSDQKLKSALTAAGAIVLHKPIKQSAFYDALSAALTPSAATASMLKPDAASHTAAVPAAVGQRLLLAEDNPVNQRVAVHMLSKLGYTVDVVDNGEQAVKAVASGVYTLVLMDCQMPVMDGFTATRAIRGAEAGSRRHLPIVAITANALHGDRESCLAAGMDDYVTKPIDAARLSVVLGSWLRSDGATNDAAAPTRQAVHAPDSKPEAIDMNRMTELFGDDHAVIDDILTVFQKSLQPLYQRIKQEVRVHGQALNGLAHELRGAATNVGALSLAELASRLKGTVASGNWREIEELAVRIDEEITRTSEFICQRTTQRKV
jgi:CheY-like chemotaxis protein